VVDNHVEEVMVKQGTHSDEEELQSGEERRDANNNEGCEETQSGDCQQEEEPQSGEESRDANNNEDCEEQRSGDGREEEEQLNEEDERAVKAELKKIKEHGSFCYENGGICCSYAFVPSAVSDSNHAFLLAHI
jgi:hypothetical protein